MNFVKYICLIPLIFFIASCEENFDPKGAFKEKYVLNCIIRGDSSFQVSTISKSYNVDGYDPYTNSVDPSIDGSILKMWIKDKVYLFKDSTIERTDTSRYNTPYKFYYIDDFQAAENDKLEIEAILPNGKVLSSQTQLPKKISWDREMDRSIPVDGEDDFYFGWISSTTNAFYLFQMKILYKIAGDETMHQYIMPVRYVDDNGTLKPEYTSPSKATSIRFENGTLNKALSLISENDPDKSKYTIYAGLLELVVFDENLYRYFSTANGYLDDYTVRIDQSDYSNINGGFGVFGSIIKQVNSVGITREYVESFGYRKG